jgi:hypothetical protein
MEKFIYTKASLPLEENARKAALDRRKWTAPEKRAFYKERRTQKLLNDSQQFGRSFTLYTPTIGKSVGLSEREFRRVANAFANALIRESKPANPHEASDIPQKIKWLNRSAFKTPDHLFLFCLYYYKGATSQEKLIESFHHIENFQKKICQRRASRWLGPQRGLKWLNAALLELYHSDDLWQYNLALKVAAFGNGLIKLVGQEPPKQRYTSWQDPAKY